MKTFITAIVLTLLSTSLISTAKAVVVVGAPSKRIIFVSPSVIEACEKSHWTSDYCVRIKSHETEIIVDIIQSQLEAATEMLQDSSIPASQRDARGYAMVDELHAQCASTLIDPTICGQIMYSEHLAKFMLSYRIVLLPGTSLEDCTQGFQYSKVNNLVYPPKTSDAVIYREVHCDKLKEDYRLQNSVK